MFMINCKQYIYKYISITILGTREYYMSACNANTSGNLYNDSMRIRLYTKDSTRKILYVYAIVLSLGSVSVFIPQNIIWVGIYHNVYLRILRDNNSCGQWSQHFLPWRIVQPRH